MSSACLVTSPSTLLEIVGAERSRLTNASCASSTLPAWSTARERRVCDPSALTRNGVTYGR